MGDTGQGKVYENRREDKKALKKFVITLAASALLGMMLSFLAVLWKEVQQEFYSGTVATIIRYLGIYGAFISAMILLILILCFYGKARRLYRSWDGENEESFIRMELLLSYALMTSSIGNLCGYFFFTLGCYVTPVKETASSDGMVHFGIVLLGMLVILTIMSISQQKIVNFEKELNPEKHGSVYDIKFNKRWLETCDEAERYVIYKAAYKAYRVMGVTFSVAWVFTVLGMMAFDTGFFPVVIVLALWMTMICAYHATTNYYAKHPSEVMK